jgi:hypothetical protein
MLLRNRRHDETPETVVSPRVPFSLCTDCVSPASLAEGKKCLRNFDTRYLDEQYDEIVHSMATVLTRVIEHNDRANPIAQRHKANTYAHSILSRP